MSRWQAEHAAAFGSRELHPDLAEATVAVLRDLIRDELGNECYECGVCGCSRGLDIHHVAHDGRAWRQRFGGYSTAYYLDILWGVLHNCGEVALLCRPCHEAHHLVYGFEERDLAHPAASEP